jgi:hypothetical protein
VDNPSSSQQPVQALTVDPQELADAFSLISRVFSGEDDFDPTRYRMRILNEQGEVEQKPFADTLLNRIMLALQEWCREEPADKYLSLCWRLFALNELIHQGFLSEFIHLDQDKSFLSIPGAIIRVAAELPLERGKGFDTQLFLDTAHKLVYG